jgi:carboxyl-terminal processing protease
MSRAILSVLFCLLLSNSYSQSQEVSKLVDRFIDTIQVHSFMRQKIDFDSLRKDTKLAVKDINETDSLLNPFRKIVAELRDSHSRVALSENKEDELALIKLFATTTYEQAGMPPQNFQHKMINGKYAYINIPGVMLEHKKTIDTLQKQVQFLDSQNPKAWIIDLTENDGGYFLPMVIPFHSLIDTNQTFSYFNGEVDKDGNEILKDKFQIPSDGLYTDTSIIAKQLGLDSVMSLTIKNNKVPIIVLVSYITASSGEITTAHFLGQNNVTVVGTKTNGLTSSNELIYIDKGYSINLMTDVLHDRKGKTYKINEGITPDILIDLNIPKGKVNYNDIKKITLEKKDVFLNKAIEILEN